MSTLKQLGEQEVIRRLTRLMPSKDDVIIHAGDDAAVVSQENSAYDLLLTSDPTVEGTHFLPDTPAKQIGHKAVGRVLSDIAAMGGEPLWVLTNLVAPASTEMERVEDLYRGAGKLASQYRTAMVGGDTSEGLALEAHVFIVRRVPKGDAVLRSGAQTGDILYVTGALGGSWPHRHLSFSPRVVEGQWLREQRWPTAMIDLSDGLATDVRHLIEQSRVGAEIDIHLIPTPAEGKVAPGASTAWEHALYDGEDFELLFTIPEAKQQDFESSWRNAFDLACTAVGRINTQINIVTCLAEQGASWVLDKKGFEHFTRKSE